MSNKGLLAIAVAVAATSVAGGAARGDITGFSGFAAVNKYQDNAVSTNAAIGYTNGGSTFQITTANNSQQTSGYYATPQNITSFTASFDYVSLPGASDANGTLAANGIGLNLIAPSNGVTTLANVGDADSMGIKGIATSASLLFNNFGGYYSYPGAVYFQTGGNVPGPLTYDANPWKPLPGPGLASGDPMHVTVSYNAGTVRYTVTDTANGKSFKSATSGVDLTGVLGGTTALVGFSGTTGGFSSDQKVSNFTFTAGTGTTTGYVKRALPTNATFAPVAISGFNQAIVVPADAGTPDNGINYITATPDNGTFLSASAGTGTTYYETGLAGSTAGTGLPTSGSTFTSAADARHTFKMPTYGSAANGPAFDSLVLYSEYNDINGVGDRDGTITFTAPTAYAGLSLLMSAGNGPADIGVVIHYQDGTTLDLGDVSAPDWYNGANQAYNAGSRVDPLGAAGEQFQDGPFGLSQVDLALPFSPKAIASIDLTLDGASDTRTVAQLMAVSGVTASIWALPGGGDASQAASWVNGVPNAVDTVTAFGTSATAASTVTIDSAMTAGSLNFENTNGYTLSGSGSVTLDVNAGQAGVLVVTGNHTVNVPVTLADSTAATVLNANSSLTFAKPITISGASTLTTSGPITLNAVDGATGSALAVSSGKTTATASLHVGGVNVANNANLTLADVATTSVLRTSSLTLGTGSTLDLGDNGLILDYSETSPAASVAAMITTAYNATGTHWSVGGLTSSKAQANSNYGIGFAEASALTSSPFAGETLDSTTLLVRVTLRGDTDLSGKVDFPDLLSLAKNYNATSGKSWVNGDSDYDGDVDFDDLLTLAKNYNQSLSASQAAELGDFASDFALAQSLVPEPTTLLLGLGAVGLGVSRRRRAQPV